MPKPLRVVMDAHVCECCFLWLASNDDSSCKHYHGHGEAEHPRALCSGLAGSWVPADDEWTLRAAQTCVGCGGEVLPQGVLFKVNQLGR